MAGPGPAAASDDLTKTLHYGELAELAAGIVAGEPYDLIESVAGKIADEVLRDERLQRGRGDGAQAVRADPADLRRRRGHGPAGPVSRAVLSLGSNLGDRLGFLKLALDAVRPRAGRRVERLRDRRRGASRTSRTS